MFGSSNKQSNSGPETNQDKLSSIFVMIVMIMFVIGSVFRQAYQDPILFKIGNCKYTYSYCKKYIAFLDEHISLPADKKFQDHFHEVLSIAQQKSSISYLCSRLGLVVSNKDMRESILRDPLFFEAGRFSRSKFLHHLARLGISENDFYELRRESLLHDQFWFFINNSYSLPADLLKKLNSSYRSLRYIRFAKVRHSDIPLSYTSHDLLQFYNENLSLFTSSYQYQYSAIAFSSKSLSKEDRVLLNHMVDKNNFDGIVKSYSSSLTFLSHEDLIRRFGKSLDYYNYGKTFSLGDCFSFYFDGTFFIVKIQSIKEPFTLPFDEVRLKVISLYERKYKPLNIDSDSLLWTSASCSPDNFSHIDLPYSISKSIFSFPLRSIQVFHLDDVSYFIIVDSIKRLKVDLDEYDSIFFKECFDQELRSAILNYSLSLVQEV